MPTWADLNNALQKVKPDQRGAKIVTQINKVVSDLAKHTDKNVIFYSSAFLQKPQVPGLMVSINNEDINGFMTGVHGLDFDKGLLLLLHTPGGLAESAETIVDYLWSKFPSIDALIPTYAMSAGTMIALGCQNVILGNQSQLGPTDPQLIFDGRPYSAHSIVAQFDEAKKDIANNIDMAHAWAPMLQKFGPALLQEARRSLVYGQKMVAGWLKEHMFQGEADADQKAHEIAKFFSGDTHGSHGRRINRDEAQGVGLSILSLEDDDALQDLSLTLYHLTTLAFDSGPATKIVVSSNGNLWIKNIQMQVVKTAT